VDADEDVFRLDVTVHDVFLMEVFKCCSHLGNILRSLWLSEPLLASEMLVEFPLASKFEDKEDALCVVEVTKQLKNIRMGEMRLDFDFPSDLFLDFALLKLRFMQHFERADKSRRLLLGQVHTTKLTFAEGLSNLEHAKMPLFGC